MPNKNSNISALNTLQSERIPPVTPSQKRYFEGNNWDLYTVKFLCEQNTKNVAVFCAVGGESEGDPEKSYVERRLYIQVENERWEKLADNFSDSEFAGPYPKAGYFNKVEVTNFNNYYKGKQISIICLYRNKMAKSRYFEFFVTRYF